ncbi:sugar transporter ERD6-like 5 [Pistacia vera]|uniref:sugar transporter ERD6-like 5 n=1 Tax=Pistacia vera TaxID=55513 RepID=UPI001262F51A|nr:sugar transporter ERD6-like 5 [Pistacia vera]
MTESGEASSGLPHEPSGPVTFKLVFSSLVAVCGSYVYGHAVGYSSPAESGIVDDLGLTTAQYAVFSSILTIGAMLGAVISGELQTSLAKMGNGNFRIDCISGWDATWLDLGRFIWDVELDLLLIAFPYVAEISPKHVRGAFTALNPMFIGKVGKMNDVEVLYSAWGTDADVALEAAEIQVGVGDCIPTIWGLFWFVFYAAPFLGCWLCNCFGTFLDRQGWKETLLLISTVGSCLGVFITGVGYLFKVRFIANIIHYHFTYLLCLPAATLFLVAVVSGNDFLLSCGDLGAERELTASFALLVYWNILHYVAYVSWCSIIAKLVPETKDRTLEEIQE